MNRVQTYSFFNSNFFMNTIKFLWLWNWNKFVMWWEICVLLRIKACITFISSYVYLHVHLVWCFLTSYQRTTFICHDLYYWRVKFCTHFSYIYASKGYLHSNACKWLWKFLVMDIKWNTWLLTPNLSDLISIIKRDAFDLLHFLIREGWVGWIG